MPHLWNGTMVPGDPRHGTRWATEAEKEVAARALLELATQYNRITLVPAPVQNHGSQKVRVQESANPDWYRSFGAQFWRTPREFSLKRWRVERALKRVSKEGIVRRNGYEAKLLPALLKHYEEAQQERASAH